MGACLPAQILQREDSPLLRNVLLSVQNEVLLRHQQNLMTEEGAIMRSSMQSLLQTEVCGQSPCCGSCWRLSAAAARGTACRLQLLVLLRG